MTGIPNVRIACARGSGYAVSVWRGRGRRRSLEVNDYAGLVNLYAESAPVGMNYDLVITESAKQRIRTETDLPSALVVFQNIAARDKLLSKEEVRKEKIRRALNE